MSCDSLFAVAILAGGRSTRMGREKATLVFEGRTLLERQVALAWSLGPQEVWVVGRAAGELGTLRAQGLPDERPGLGPLGGLVTVLGATAAPHVLLLAVDMPRLTEAFLKGLLARRRPGMGVVPRTARGWEPLAAVYPCELAGAARAALAAGERGLQRFLESDAVRSQVVAEVLGAPEEALLTNWNSPGDVGG